MGASAIITVPGTITNPTLGKSWRDALLDTAGGGVPWLADLAKPYSFPQQAAPVNGSVIRNLDESGRDGSVALSAGQALAFAGGGLDFSAVTAKPTEIVGPAAAMADIWGSGAGAAVTATITGDAVTGLQLTAGGANYGSGLDVTKKWSGSIPLLFSGGAGANAAGTATIVNGVVTAVALTAGGAGYTSAPVVTVPAGPQHFLVCLYMKLPLLAEWNTAAGIQTIFAAAGTTGGFSSDPELVNIAQNKVNAGTAGFIAHRQRGINVADQTQYNVDAAHLGQVTQVAFWRNGAEQGFRLRSAAVTSPAFSTAPGLPNAANFSAKNPRAGVCNPYSGFGTSQAWVRFRLFRAFIENLATSGRAPIAVLDADFARVAARGAFS